MPRLQTYVDETTMEKIKNLADENHMPVSKFVSKLVSDSLSQKSFFEKKTHQLLGQILCCVYDADIQKTNYSAVKNLIKNIEQDLKGA